MPLRPLNRVHDSSPRASSRKQVEHKQQHPERFFGEKVFGRNLRRRAASIPRSRIDQETPDLNASTATSARSTCSVMRNWGNVLDPAYPETGSGKHTDCGLRPRARGSSSVSPRRPHSNVQSGNPSILCRSRSSRSRLHRRVRRALQPVGFHVLSA
jgi:hypothetical protein